MKTILQAAAALLPLLAIPADAASSLRCNTRMGTKSVHNVPTSTVTITASLHPSLTINVQSTVTHYSGATNTYTVVSTQTNTFTDSTVTDTFSSTTTEYTSTTFTVPTTITTTSTSTAIVTSTSTTTIATTNGFFNIQDTLNRKSLQRRAPPHPHADMSPVNKRARVKHGVLAHAHPSRVDCTLTKPNTKTVTVVSRLPATTVTIPYWAAPATFISTLTTTTTLVPPRVSTTLTSTEVDTISYTSTTILTNTQSTTTTATALMHGPTVWNACNPNNYFGPDFTHTSNGATFPYYVSNVDNNGAFVGSNYKIVANGAGSMLECCNSCMKFGTCETFMFRAGTRNCFLMYHDGETCPNQSNHPNFLLSQSGTDQGAGYQVGNGLCGFTYSGNSDSTAWTVDGH